MTILRDHNEVKRNQETKLESARKTRDVSSGDTVSPRIHILIYRIEIHYREREVRARGGCLGFGRRRRTRQAAKKAGDPQTGVDPAVSEWGNPAGFSPSLPV